MKSRAWTFYSLIIFVATAAFLIDSLGSHGGLRQRFVQETLVPSLHRFSVLLTDLKFQWRGPTSRKNKIAIVEIDSASIEELGHWPWRRDYIAYLIERTFQAGASTVGLDLVFSEAQQAVPEELEIALKRKGLAPLLKEYDYDLRLAKVMGRYSNQLTSAWISESPCRPAFSDAEYCPVLRKEALATFPADFGKFAFEVASSSPLFLPLETSIYSAPTVVASIAPLEAASRHAGFANDFRDVDGIVRSASLLMLANGKPHPSLALEMAKLANGDQLTVSWDNHSGLRRLSFAHAAPIPVTASGMAQINFRGPARMFPYLAAKDVLREEDGSKNLEPLQGAHVLIGVSAVALADIGPTPFDRAMSGVEVHATLLDNILAGDLLTSPPSGTAALFFLMTLGAFAFVLVGRKREARTALVFFALAIASLVALDFLVFFPSNWNLDTSFLYLELLSLGGGVLSEKYIRSERHRKFLKTSFSKSVAPAMVDLLLREPKLLSTAGRREKVTVLFSHLRDFGAIAETIEAKVLGEFLIDYHNLMTSVVFQHGGTLDKYFGDAVMAFWGAPLPENDHAARAVAAAQQMAEVVKANQERYKKVYGIDVKIGVGLHAGMVTVGNLGSDKSFGYTVVGETVNIAARLEAATRLLGATLLCSRETIAEISRLNKTLPAIRALGKAQSRGTSDSVDLVQLLDRRYPQEGLEAFEAALQFFLAGNLEKAAEGFRHAGKIFSLAFGAPDLPSQRYLERCDALINRSKFGDWDPSWDLAA